MRRNTGTRGVTASLALFAILATACGARLDPAVQAEAVENLAAGGGQIVTSESGGADTTAASSTQPDGSTTAEIVTDGSGAQPAAGGAVGAPAQGSTTTTGAQGQQTTTTTDPAAPQGGSGTAAKDTRSAPAGGNGGATDVGVFEDRIVIGNGVDNAGAVPGIFIDAQLATQAFVAWFTATEGTIYGRRLELLTRDTRLDAGANREVYLEFCEKTFAAVGSMSAFDEGIVNPVRECGIPDIRSAVVNPVAMAVDTVYSSDALSPTLYPMNQFHYWDETYPGAKVRAGMLYVDNDTTRKQTRLVRTSTEKIGYEWIVDSGIGLAETNYSTYVIELKEKDVKFLFFQGDAPQAVRLAKAMRQQSYWPDVYALQQNLYKPALISQGGADIETAELALGSVMNENIQHHPELQTYRKWLKQIDPEAEPTGQGTYSWGAGLLFVQLLKQIGPDLTRAKLVEAIRKVHDSDGNGLYAPQDVGGKIPANCHIMAKVQGGKFVPIDPPGGTTFSCRGTVQAGSTDG